MPILIIEDNPMNTKLVRDLLHANGYSTLAAQDATTGLQMARLEKPSLILMDIDLPGMNGLDATRVLKSDPVTAGIPILALTAYAMKGDEKKALDAGCDAYMSKPIDIRQFMNRVRILLGLGDEE